MQCSQSARGSGGPKCFSRQRPQASMRHALRSKRALVTVCMSPPPPAVLSLSRAPQATVTLSARLQKTAQQNASMLPAPRAQDTAVLQLQRMARAAQEQRELYATQLVMHEQQDRLLKARVEKLACQQDAARAQLAALQQMLSRARYITREQHLSIFSESVHVCGRQESHKNEYQIFLHASRNAKEQLEGYEQTLTRLVGLMVASMAELQGVSPLPMSSAQNNIVPVPQQLRSPVTSP